jgi:hypothetical protein
VGGGDEPPRPGGPSREASGAIAFAPKGPDGRRPEVCQKSPARVPGSSKVVGPHGGVNSPTTGTLRGASLQTSRAGRLGIWRTCGNTLRSAQARRRADFDKPRYREVSRPVGPSGPLASRAPSVLSRATEMRIRAYPALAQRIRAMTLACFIPPLKGEGGSARSAELGGVGFQSDTNPARLASRFARCSPPSPQAGRDKAELPAATIAVYMPATPQQLRSGVPR